MHSSRWRALNAPTCNATHRLSWVFPNNTIFCSCGNTALYADGDASHCDRSPSNGPASAYMLTRLIQFNITKGLRSRRICTNMLYPFFYALVGGCSFRKSHLIRLETTPWEVTCHKQLNNLHFSAESKKCSTLQIILAWATEPCFHSCSGPSGLRLTMMSQSL